MYRGAAWGPMPTRSRRLPSRAPTTTRLRVGSSIDPGIPLYTYLKVSYFIKKQGWKVTHFQSVCMHSRPQNGTTDQ